MGWPATRGATDYNTARADPPYPGFSRGSTVSGSDHGYAVSKLFSREEIDPDVIEKLRENFGAARYKKANGPWQERFMPPIVMSAGGHHVIMGQRKWKVQGGFPHVCHGGLSLLEVAVPWIEFEAI